MTNKSILWMRCPHTLYMYTYNWLNWIKLLNFIWNIHFSISCGLWNSRIPQNNNINMNDLHLVDEKLKIDDDHININTTKFLFCYFFFVLFLRLFPIFLFDFLMINVGLKCLFFMSHLHIYTKQLNLNISAFI